MTPLNNEWISCFVCCCCFGTLWGIETKINTWATKAYCKYPTFSPPFASSCLKHPLTTLTYFWFCMKLLNSHIILFSVSTDDITHCFFFNRFVFLLIFLHHALTLTRCSTTHDLVKDRSIHIAYFCICLTGGQQYYESSGELTWLHLVWQYYVAGSLFGQD